MTEKFDLQTYLIERNLNEPKKDVGAEILESDQLLAELAGIWRGHRTAIEALLQARIQPIREEIVLRAHPAEVMTLRQAMVELGALVSDLERYASEHERRLEAKEAAAALETPQEQPIEPEEATESL